MKDLVRSYFPTIFYFLKKIKTRLSIEIRTLKQIGLIQFVRLVVFGRFSRVKRDLPVQPIKRIKIPGVKFCSQKEVLDLLDGAKVGGHSFYLSPNMLRRSAFSPLLDFYPGVFGLKIKAEINDTHGMSRKRSSAVQRLAISDHSAQMLISNILFLEGLSPRVLDVFEIDGGGTTVVASIVEHAEYLNTSVQDCEGIIRRFKRLVEKKVLTLTNYNGFNHMDFLCPKCNGNMRLTDDGRRLYVDTQNFSLGTHFSGYLRHRVKSVQEVSHFGDKSIILGGNYLYQSIPGVGLPAKRDPLKRSHEMDRMIAQIDQNLEGTLILDVGCNLGVMGAYFLSRGAHWYHGLDLNRVVKAAENVSLLIGLTRFSYAGCQISNQTDLLEGAPNIFRGGGHTIWISYLSVRRHLGWVDGLQSLSWDYMWYEGHEGESATENQKYISELHERVPVEIMVEGSSTDGTSLERYLAVLKRL